MKAPLRIHRPGASRANDVEDDIGSYYSRLLLMIPAEVIGIYVAGSGVIPLGFSPWAITAWSILCLFGVIVIRVLGTRDSSRSIPPDKKHVIISAISYIIWVLTLGGPFTAWGIAVPSWICSLAVLFWTFIVPVVYKGPKD